MVSIIVPVIRPDKFKECQEAIEKNHGAIPYEIIWEEDTERIGCPKMVKNLVTRCNFDFIMFLGDDTLPQLGFLEEAINAMASLPDCWGLVALNDGRKCSVNEAAHWMIHRKMLDVMKGEPFPICYQHCFCDNELSLRAQLLGRYIYADKSQVIHNHPMLRQEVKTDEHYQKVYSNDIYSKDQSTFYQRMWELIGRGNEIKISHNKLAEGLILTKADIQPKTIKKVAILIPHSHPTFSQNFTVSMFGVLAYTFDWNSKHDNKYQFDILVSGSGWIDKMRNSLANDAVTVGSDYLMWMDTDQMYPPDTIVKMLKHFEEDDGIEAVGGLIVYKSPPYVPHLYPKKANDGKTYHMARNLSLNQLFNVDGAGFGCIMMKVDVFMRTPKPWFEFITGENGEITQGEDLGFCAKANPKIVIDPTIIIKHLREVGYDIYDYVNYNKLEINDGVIDPGLERMNEIYDEHHGRDKSKDSVIRLH